mmetsp:Transcript_123417/g.384104  ORF Transcript_123417/g.384104 Transcript_123417/m.384104 type:complete len:227 (+) Transcript_123417:220-900(+)
MKRITVEADPEPRRYVPQLEQVHGPPLLHADLVGVLVEQNLLNDLDVLAGTFAPSPGIGNVPIQFLDNDKLGVGGRTDLGALDQFVFGVVLDNVHPFMPQSIIGHSAVQRLREEPLLPQLWHRAALEPRLPAVLLLSACIVPLDDEVEDPLNPCTHVILGHRVTGRLVPPFRPERVLVELAVVPGPHLARLPIGHTLDAELLLVCPVDVSDLDILPGAFAFAKLIQ